MTLDNLTEIRPGDLPEINSKNSFDSPFDIKKVICLNKLRNKVKRSLIDILREGEYFGRLLAIGLTSVNEKIFILYGLTGRSMASRARRLVHREDGLYTEPLPEASFTAEQRELLIYPVVLFNQGVAASNGQQTREIAKRLSSDIDDPEIILKEALAGWTYEPDSPTFTPRISTCLLPKGRAAMALIRRGENGLNIHEYYSFHLAPGEGHLLTTYNGPNLHPPPSFSGPPLNFVITKVQARELLDEFYEALAPHGGKEDWRVAAAAITLSLARLELLEMEIINRF